MDRNTFRTDKYMFNPVEDFTIFAGFSCCGDDEDTDLDDFIRDDAERHLRDRMAVTYGLFLPDFPENPLAFATLQNDALKIECPTYPYKTPPAVKIGRLGVDRRWQDGGIGTELLTIIKTLMCTRNRTGCRYITLDAYNKPRVLNFYLKNGFDFLKEPKEGRKQVLMYFDLQNHLMSCGCAAAAPMPR